MATQETVNPMDLTQFDRLDLQGWDTSNGHETEPGKEPTSAPAADGVPGLMPG